MPKPILYKAQEKVEMLEEEQIAKDAEIFFRRMVGLPEKEDNYDKDKIK